ncbi:twin-arginine translocase TatA/TatE family subunit [Tsuneonella mangrovi]|uniref:twin-arginine translocase TatA/TatE family subunit n=1 Tax=Tsuneonella mangrovi TaxID=1982042 RepID=UPI000BA2A2F0|nr:twin-arginine translocase TatA/TatE family subunit [Tsuneonella mangrovi]
MQVGVWQLLIIALVILVLFGKGRISEMMGDFGRGINSFKQGMNEGEKGETHKLQPPQADPAPTAEPKPADKTES